MGHFYLFEGGIFEFSFELDPSCYKVGETFEDSRDRYVPLNEKQVKFFRENPNASAKEVWETSLVVISVDEMQVARDNKVQEILSYNNSEEVNSFIFQGRRLWVEREERVSFKTAVEAKIALGITEVELPTKQLIGVKLNCQLVLKMLYMLENYCSLADTQMKKHLYAIERLADIEGIKSYNYKEGMPAIINFDNA